MKVSILVSQLPMFGRCNSVWLYCSAPIGQIKISNQTSTEARQAPGSTVQVVMLTPQVIALIIDIDYCRLRPLHWGHGEYD